MRQVLIGKRWYRVIESSDLGTLATGRPVEVDVAHSQRIVWIRPGLSEFRRFEVIFAAASRAYRTTAA